MFQLSYTNYLVILLVVTGIMVLVFDAKKYNQKQQAKEEKVSRFLGWINITLGTLVLIGNWVIQKFLL